jgi:hypothetical protein
LCQFVCVAKLSLSTSCGVIFSPPNFLFQNRADAG